jgi:hypothetical protein
VVGGAEQDGVVVRAADRVVAAVRERLDVVGDERFAVGA